YTTSRLDEDLFSFSGYIIAARNIAERKVTEQRIRYLARIDPLTKLSNRMQFQHLLQRGIARASRRNHQIVMFYLDVDRFKDINDTFGHTVGDTCLEWIATRLTELLPEKSIIGRLASDEFAIAIEWDGDKNDLAAYTQSTARHIISELNKIMLIQGHEIHLTISVGIAAYPRDADNVVGLIRSADAALCRAKKMPGNSFEFFDAKMNAEEAERLMLKSKLRRSYELDELLVQYQPKFDVMTGEVSGAEALVRWELSERGLILPSEFIPLAEETNLIIEIGEWVLDKVCADIHHWEQHTNIPGRIAINLSLKQLSQPNMLDRIKNTLSRHHVIPADLELEITESTLMNDPEQAIQRLTELHDAGLTLSIDDFGTGYSSLSALRQFPISTLKIDRSFVRDMNTDKDGVKIISAIIDMAHSMNMDVIAEGVESELQLRRLKALRCNHVQGLLFGKPMAADRFLDLLMSGQEERHFHHNLFGK
ncbi:MAG: EAL domain-containing protein, partial [Gammaproteobacteria bacterium]|nr:EAL domain-containing protein [Gammaproteobacteria bacterium]